MTRNAERFEAIVVGSGFAGAVTACRLSQAGVETCVLERGRRFSRDDLPVYPVREDPKTSSPPEPDFSKLLWRAGGGCWDVRNLGDVVVVQGAGFGGGSLIYANVHLRAPPEVFEDRWPEPFRRAALEPYYDLAAYMLDVKPVPAEERPPKAAQLERAATSLGGRVRFFNPPLAVNFGSGRERFGRHQGACDLQGNCCFGCPQQAKNTLDLNYLALAENPPDQGARPVEVRTWAEVCSIESLEELDGGTRPVYRVLYRDLLVDTGEPIALEAANVFLCAGAINTTELMMRSHNEGKLRFEVKHLEHLGRAFHPNADNLAAVFDCDQPQEADRGPTITSSLLYQGPARNDGRRGDWLMIQDGGLPADLEPLLGAFRSPLWMHRNGFREGPAPLSSFKQRIAYAPLPFEELGDLLSGLTRGVVRPIPSLAQEILEFGLAALRGAGDLGWQRQEGGERPWSLVPTQLREALREIRSRLLADVSQAAEPIMNEIFNEAAETSSYNLESLLTSVPLARDFAIDHVERYNIPRQLLRLGVQLVWGSESDLTRAIAEQLLDLIAPEQDRVLRRAAEVLRWALDHRYADGHTALLLCMGRDAKAGELWLYVPMEPAVGSVVTGADSGACGILMSCALERGSWARNDAEGVLVLARVEGGFKREESLVVGPRVLGRCRSSDMQLAADDLRPSPDALAGLSTDLLRRAARDLPLRLIFFEPLPDALSQRSPPLRARLPGPFETPERGVHERILRDLASEVWHGELRTDPLWSFLGKRVTVHSQGGCPMAASAEHGFTAPNGEVFGCEGLFVMDAAAFPGPVGVNPSATIAAVAEYKVEQFIRRQPGLEVWKAPQLEDARKWADGCRDELDPIEALARQPCDEPQSLPIGIRFTENMKGRLDPSSRTSKRAVVETALRAEIDDLARFLASYRDDEPAAGRRQEPDPIPIVSGWVKIEGLPERLEVTPAKSCMRLFVNPSRDPHGRERRSITYHLDLQGADSGDLWALDGQKDIVDDEGFDLWEDTTTLRFELKSLKDRLRCRGLLRLPASAFFGTQLPSFEATHTNDPARRIWALAAFGRFFLGNLVDVYLPELEQAGALFGRLMGRSHV